MKCAWLWPCTFSFTAGGLFETRVISFRGLDSHKSKRLRTGNAVQPRLFFYALTSALAGFLFGFDTVVISGAEKTIQSLWNMEPLQHGLAMSMALWGTVLGSLIGGWPTQRFGRTKTLLWIGILYLVSAVWSALAAGPYSFMLARFIGGLGVGISTVAAPLYIAEIAPAALRGRLAGMFQFNIVFGILVAFLSNYLLGSIGENAWRWMLGVEAIPAVIYTALCFTLPESPRWLIGCRGDRAAGLAVLEQINPASTIAEREQLADEIAASVDAGSTDFHGFWSRRLRTPILLAFLIAFFNQLSGINAILYFAPRIFELTGLSSQAALLQSVGIGLTNLVFTFVGLYLIDRLGRRTLLIIGSIGYILSLGLCAATFFSHQAEFALASSATKLANLCQQANAASSAEEFMPSIARARAEVENCLASSPDAPSLAIPANATLSQTQRLAEQLSERAVQASGSGGSMVLLGIFAFIAAHAVGQGAVIWVFISEIFPNRFRAAGQSLGSFTHWIFAALLTLFFPKMVSYFAPGYVFGFFCCMMVLQLIWVVAWVPETKGVSLEELQRHMGIE